MRRLLVSFKGKPRKWVSQINQLLLRLRQVGQKICSFQKKKNVHTWKVIEDAHAISPKVFKGQGVVKPQPATLV